MNTTLISTKIEELLLAKFEEEEFKDCFLVELEVLPSKKINVFVDSDSGITFEKCRKISRHLEAVIDEEQWLGQKYTLEVSSPGIGRPLKFSRQYPRNIGRKVEVKITEGTKVTGLLTAVENESITIEDKVRVKEGKKKVKKLVTTVIPFEDIVKFVVKISF